MKFSFLYKALSILLVIIFLITGFAIVSSTQTALAELENQPEKSFAFKYIILFTTGFSLFLLGLFRPKKEVVVEKMIKHETSEDKKIKKESGEEENNVQLLSDDELDKEVEEIFPQEGIEDLKTFTDKLLTNISKKVEIAQGVIFFKEKESGAFKASGKYAYFSEEPPKDFNEGETLSGQVAKNQKLINIEDIPEGYVKIISGLGTGYPNHLLIVPAIFDDKTVGIIEIASFKRLDKNFENLMQAIAKKLVEKIYKVTED